MRSRYGLRRSTRGRSRRVVRRPRPYKAKSSVTQQVVSALTGAALNRLKSKLGLNTETKFMDTQTTTFTCTNSLAASAALTLTPIPQGDTVNSRNGSGFRMTRYRAKGCIYNNSANTLPGRVRIIWVNWGKAIAAAATSILYLTTDFNSELNSDPGVPFKVISDKVYHVGVEPSGGLQSGGIPVLQEIEFDYQPLSHHVKWIDTDTAGGPSGLIEGQIAMYIIADSFSVGAAPYIKQYQRVEFVDN